MNPAGKRLPDKARVTHDDLKESVEAWTKEIIGKCRNHKMRVAVFLTVVPIDDPKPQWAHNMMPAGASHLLRGLADDVLAAPAGLVVAGPGDIPKA